MENFYLKLIKTFPIVLLILVCSTISKAQLTAGDIAFVGINSDADPNELAIVTLNPIPSGQVVIFTDYAWNGTALETANPIAEGNITWTLNQNIPAGTILRFTIGSGAVIGGNLSTYGTVSATGWSGDAIASGGDNWFILQGSLASPNFIYGFANWSTAAYGVRTWPTTGVTFPNATISYLPSGLSNGTTAHILSGSAEFHYDNNVYTGPKTGTKENMLTALADQNNWLGSEEIVHDIAPGGQYFTGTNPIFTVGSPAIIVTEPVSLVICENANATFTVSATNATGYVWQVNSGSGFNNISNNTIYSGATTSTLTITSASASLNGNLYRALATGVVNDTSTIANLTVNENPDVSTTITGSSISANLEGAEYAWFNCNNLNTSLGTSQTFIPTVSGEYRVNVTINQCSDTSECEFVEVVLTAFKDKQASRALFTFYPNPVSDQINIEFKESVVGKISVTDLNGQVVIEKEISEETLHLFTDKIDSGIYILKITSDKVNTTEVLSVVK